MLFYSSSSSLLFDDSPLQSGQISSPSSLADSQCPPSSQSLISQYFIYSPDLNNTTYKTTPYFNNQLHFLFLNHKPQNQGSFDLLSTINKLIKQMHKFLAFTGICGLGGLAYLKYFEYNKINMELEQLLEKNQLGSHLYETNQESSFSIDTVMDSFERGYNQFSINSYRQTLAGLAQGKILETCAGSNRNLKFYKPQTQLTLIDFSPNMVSTGSSKLSPLVRYNYIIGDVMAMPFKDNQFDSVVDTFGLQYVLNPHKALAQMQRVCKDGGKLMLMNEGLSSTVELHYWQNMKWGYNLLKGGYFSNRNWQKLIAEFNFQVEHRERKKNGKLYIYVLKNNKNQPKEQKK